MAGVSHKQQLEVIDGTPEKRLFLSIISDYDLRTGLCELEAGPRAEERRNGGVRRRKVRIAVGRMIGRRIRCGLLELEPDEDTPIIWRTTLFPAPPEEIWRTAATVLR